MIAPLLPSVKFTSFRSFPSQHKTCVRLPSVFFGMRGSHIAWFAAGIFTCLLTACGSSSRIGIAITSSPSTYSAGASATAGTAAHAPQEGLYATNGAFTLSAFLPSERAVQADSFVDSIGIVTHLSYNNTPYYTQWPQVLAALQSLGVRHIRDGFYPWASSSPYIQEHQELAAAGIKCDYVVPFDSTTTAASIEQFSSEVQDMESLEAPNECDVAGNCGATSTSGIANAVAFLPVINAAGSNLGVPVYGPSFTQQSSYLQAGNIASQMTYNNLHIYFGGRNPGSDGWGDVDAEGHAYGSFDWWLDQGNVDAPNVPAVVTETGYLSFPETSTPFTLPESVQASYVPRSLLLAYKHGIARTYLYELIDEVSSPGYGLMDSTLTPKPAYNAVQNLISILSDEGTAFTPGSLSYSIEGGDATLNHLLLQKRDGSFWLVLWLEQSSFDPVSASPTPVNPQNLLLTLSSASYVEKVLQFTGRGLVTAGTLGGTGLMNRGTLFALTVSDQITIVQIGSSNRKTLRRRWAEHSTS